MNETEVLLQALLEIWPELPELAGEKWPWLEGALLVQLRAIEAVSPSKVAQQRNALLALFDSVPAARARLLHAYANKAPSRLRGGVRQVPAIAGSTKFARYLEIPIFFATDRTPAGNGESAPYFTGERSDGKLTFGIARVSVPDDHRRGALEKPSWWKLQFSADPERFVVVLGVELSERAEFVTRARQLIANAPLHDALIFLHGYNVSFEDSARRAAQIAYDLNFEGLTMLYSWASEGAFIRYPVDRVNATTWSPRRFREFLTLSLAELGASNIHVIAHSMGNEILVNALATFDSKSLPAASAKLRQVIFAAPDVDAANFCDLAAAFRSQAQRCTLYASSKDKALLASQALQKYARAGQAGEGLIILEGVDTIDASDLDTGFMSHSYLGDRTSILSDVHYLIRKDIAPDERDGLARVESAKGRYWTFRPQQK